MGDGHEMYFSLYILYFLLFYFISLIVLLPLLDPSLDTVNVGFHLIGLVARQLNDNLAVKGVTRLLQQHFHNLRVEVLLQLGLGIISARG